jgi:ribonuclease Z
MVRAVMQLSYSKIAVPHRIHELKEIPCHYDKPPAQPVVNTRADYFCGERLGGTDIYPDASGKYHLFTENGMTVHAAPMEHTIPCVGYVVTEDDRPGALMPEKVADIVKRNKAALTAKYTALGRQAMSFYQDLKVLRQEETFTFPDGTEVVGKDIVLPPSKGRKIVFMGDTSSGKHIADLAQDCDVLVHEATNAYFPEDCSERRHTYSRLEEDTISHGHSTPEMAGRFAAQIRAKQLIMSHFSARYNGDSGLRSMQIMWRIEDMARRAHAEEQRRLSRGRNCSGGSAAGAVDHKNRGGRNDASDHRHPAPEKPTLVDKSAETGGVGEVVLGENDVLAAWDFMCVSVEMKGAEQREKVKFKAVTTYD